MLIGVNVDVHRENRGMLVLVVNVAATYVSSLNKLTAFVDVRRQSCVLLQERRRDVHFTHFLEEGVEQGLPCSHSLRGIELQQRVHEVVKVAQL